MAAGLPDYASLLRLDDQVHVVVGAGQGIGRQAAHAFASVGARVLCVDVDAARARAVAAETGGMAAECDVTVAGEIDRVLRDGERSLGPISGVTNIVGMVRWTDLADATDEDWVWQDAIVVRQAHRTLRAAIPSLRRAGGGSLTFVASVSALTSAPGHGLYGMSKAALISMMRTAAMELGPSGIRVNTVSPGVTRTPRLIADSRFEEPLRENARRTPLRRVAEPSDIAAALLFLSSGLARHITGQDLVVDGGLSQTWPLATPGD
jgi:NAD(P)-dependent dehydrogenase (short-subunit alcohol dehydrogenase family)